MPFVFYFQVGVEIRDELQLLAPSEIRDDIYREVSKKRRMIDTIGALGVIIWHRNISILLKFSKYYLQYIISKRATDYFFKDRLFHKING
jgi:hypothetical protein